MIANNLNTNFCYSLENTVVDPPLTPASIHPHAILDSGTTGTFLTQKDAIHLQNSKTISDGPTVLSASGTEMPSTTKGTLNLSQQLTPTAQSAFVLDNLKTGSLISLAQLCDDDCIAIFTNYDVNVVKNNQVIITGRRESSGLWSIPIAPNIHVHQANGILRTDKPKRELAEYLHATFGSPAPSTFLNAIRQNHLITVPGLDTNLISKHLPKSIATALGHQDQESKNLRSTKDILDSDIPYTPPEPSDVVTTHDITPPLEPKSQNICCAVISQNEISKSYSDQTGKFPVPSSRGNHYIFILYHRDTNSIHATAIPNRQAATLRDAWESTHKMLIQQGSPPDLHILDNECSQDVKDAFAKYNIAFQRVPPKEHRANAAERAIRTFKNHFTSILCTVDSNYPMSEWDRLLPQAIMTLNLLRSSRTQPSLSAHASLFGNFDFNRTPLAPPGTRVVAHQSADSRASFAQHGRVGWYIGPSMQHYRCYRVYFPDTMSEVDVLKVDFFPEKIPFPRVTNEDYLKQTAEDMLHLLQKTSSLDLNPATFGSPILNAYAKIASLLGRATEPPPITRPSPAIVVPTPVQLPIINPVALDTPAPVVIPAPIPRVEIPTPAPVPRVQTTALQPPVASPRVQEHVPATYSPPMPSYNKTPPSPPAPRYHPYNKYSYLSSMNYTPYNSHSPRPLYNNNQPFFQRRPTFGMPQRPYYAQSVQHDPTVSGKMFDPVSGKAETIDSLRRGPDSKIWNKSLSNELARCAQGLNKHRKTSDRIIGNNTIFFIKPHQVPDGRKVTYANFVCTMRPNKAEEYRIRMTVGGDKLDAFQDVRSPAVGLTDTKLHINSTISDAHKGARYCTGDLKDFFLVSDMKIYQYMRLHRRYITSEIAEEYNFSDDHFDSKGYIYIEIRKGMYGLKEAAILAYDQLKAHLKKYGYEPTRFTPGLWKHITRPTTFTLAVDDFGIKYFSKEDAEHLFAALADKYALTQDWTGSSYLGFTLDWHYDAVVPYVDVSMPDYVPKNLKKLGHTPPARPQHAPHAWTKPAYGQKVQYANSDTSEKLDAKGIKRVQSIAGTFLYYGRAQNPLILAALNEISNQQASPTVLTQAACNQLLDYLHTHPDSVIRYYASDMILCIVSDAAYLVLPKARSRCAALFTLTNLPTTNPPNPTPNGPLHVLCKTMRGVPSSAAEAETGGIFNAAQEAIPLLTTLKELGHTQPITGTPIETDNSTAHNILTASVRMKRSKSFDMRYHWVKDRIAQKQFFLYWAKGKWNRADYFTKHHPPSHHKLMRYSYLQRPQQSNSVMPHVQGCVSPFGLSRLFPRGPLTVVG